MVFARFSDVLAAIDDLKERRIVQDYAIHGAVAQLFWDEPIYTLDLDVLVLFPPAASQSMVDLRPIYEWAKERRYVLQDEHIVISGIPVQFTPAPDTLAEEAVRTAANHMVDGRLVRVVRPEFLISLWLQGSAKSRRRRERAEKLMESGRVDESLLAELMTRYNLSW